jgi:hypothetical protein
MLKKIKLGLRDHFTVYAFMLPTGARQGLCKHVPAATNTHATIEESVDASFSMLSVLYQRKATGSSQYFLHT